MNYSQKTFRRYLRELRRIRRQNCRREIWQNIWAAISYRGRLFGPKSDGKYLRIKYVYLLMPQFSSYNGFVASSPPPFVPRQFIALSLCRGSCCLFKYSSLFNETYVDNECLFVYLVCWFQSFMSCSAFRCSFPYGVHSRLTLIRDEI